MAFDGALENVRGGVRGRRDDGGGEGGVGGVGVGVYRASSSSVVSRVRVDITTDDEARGARRRG